ncbi:MAG: 16S rRNA (guanine(966)-N(2))-methyltransferase RsmD [Actinomycetota bacterium]|nr:16S rRNA (guanine(966)-N(2))-methyltransferase RsmD [Actinomycetota bacterium]
MTRIIAGAAGGRRLAVPSGTATRPTADRVREALFSAVTSAVGEPAGARVLDLYAGSGALGLEALSRGAEHALLVEADARVLRTLRANVAALDLPGAEVRADRVERVLASSPPAAYDLALADPPYALDAADVDAVLSALAANGWLAPGALVVLERSSRGRPPAWPQGVQGTLSRRYGEATLWYGRAAR